MPNKRKSTRRDFIKTASAAIAVPYIITSAALGNQDRAAGQRPHRDGRHRHRQHGNGDQGAFLGRGDVQYVADLRCAEGRA